MTTKRNAVPKTTLRQKAQLMSGSEIERTLVEAGSRKFWEKNGGVGWLGTWSESASRASPLAERAGQNDSAGRKRKGSRRHARYHVLSR